MFMKKVDSIINWIIMLDIINLISNNNQLLSTVFLFLYIFEIIFKIKFEVKYLNSKVFYFDLLLIIVSLSQVYEQLKFLKSLRFLKLLKMKSVNKFFEIYTDNKKDLNQVFKAITIIFVFSSILIYNFEKEAQPDVFTSVFTGFWWTFSTLITVGYGDVYPVTLSGKLLAVVIGLFGIGIIAIPSAIIVSSFRDESNNLKEIEILKSRKIISESEFEILSKRITNNNNILED